MFTFIIAFGCLAFINVKILSTDNPSKLNLPTLMSIARADGEDCGGGCPPGFECVNGVCCQLEQATRESCTSYQFCWSCLCRIYCPGHEQTCPANPSGVANCSGYACQCDQDPC